MRGKVILVVAVLIVLAVVQIVRPAHLTVQAVVPSTYQVPGTAPAIHWPTSGEAALAVAGVGTIGQSGPETPVPIASVAKIMTAYIVLQKHPLPPGSDGPSVTATAADQKVYEDDLAKGESVVKIQAGESLTERQMLEALLLPSANNVATMLANWVSGSEQAFVTEMNATAKRLGMSHTTYTDASGFDPTTVSTATDQLKVTEAAMGIQAFRDIVKMPQTTLPIEGTVYNVDYDLGKDGIVGVKTGSTDQAGGCFVFASYANVGDQNVLVYGAVLGQGGEQPLMAALSAAETLLNDAKSRLTTVPIAKSGSVYATVNGSWTQPVSATVDKNVTFVGWPGMEVKTELRPKPLGDTLQKGSEVGTLHITSGDQHLDLPLKVEASVPAPSYVWRLKRVR